MSSDQFQFNNVLNDKNHLTTKWDFNNQTGVGAQPDKDETLSLKI